MKAGKTCWNSMHSMVRPYHPESTPSRPIREIKLDWAQLATSTRLSDRPGTLSAVVFMHKPHNGAKQPVLLPIPLLPSHLLLFHLQLAGPSMHTPSVWPHSATGLWWFLAQRPESLLPSYHLSRHLSHPSKHSLVELLMRAP